MTLTNLQSVTPVIPGAGASETSGGQHDDFDIATVPADIWAAATAATPTLYPFPPAAGTVSVASSSANDAPAGTGAREVRVTGLAPTTFTPIVEDIALGATGAVQMIRINETRVIDAGSSDANEGHVTASIGGVVVCAIPAGFNLSSQAVFTVPDDGFTWRLKSVFVSIVRQATSAADVALVTRRAGELALTSNQIGLNSQGSNAFQVEIDGFGLGPLPIGMDFALRVLSVSANSQGVSGILGFTRVTP